MTSRQSDIQPDRQINKQIGKQKDRQAEGSEVFELQNVKYINVSISPLGLY